MDRTARLKFIGWWLLIGLIAAGASALKWPSVHLGDEYLPFGMDAFYHARRILDTVADPSAFYEIDYKIHAPEGSLLTWPWGYDYAMAWLIKGAMALGISGPPMRIAIWLPVLAVFIPAGLMLLLARRLGLPNGLVVLAGLAMALSPLTQLLFGVGQLDHHFAEYIFVLATLVWGLKWLTQPSDRASAIVLGVVLGVAPAIHNGLFVLQIPLLAAMLVLWVQNIRLPLRQVLQFAAAFLASTVAVLLPSLPFRLGLFEFYTLSWFHLYVAVCSAVAAIALAAVAKSTRNIALLAVGALVLLIPIAGQFAVASGFLAGTAKRLDTIIEMRSLPFMASTPAGRQDLTLMFSALVWLLPLTTLYCAWQAWRERATPRVFFWISCIFGALLMVSQLRMHYFGSFALYLPVLIFAQACMARWQNQSKAIALAVSLVFVAAYWMPGRWQLPGVSPPAGDANFRVLRPILEDLRRACAADPGIVLADNDVGHYIRYYTDCSVIANNFLLTPQHAAKIRQIDYLTSLPAAALPGAAPFVRYILLRPAGIMHQETGPGMKYMSYSQIPAQLITDLLLKRVEDVPSSYTLIGQANIQESADEPVLPYIRLYKVDPVAPRTEAVSAASRTE